jgi:two-component system, chemotaxis family, response regulator Rcp1
MRVPLELWHDIGTLRPPSLVHAGFRAPQSAPKVASLHVRGGPLRSVLLVEDNPGDIRLVREALATGPIALQLTVAEDGEQALRLLRDASRRPDLILLDLNLPAVDGRTVLRQLKSDPAYLCTPIVVLTSSDAPQDVWSAYQLHANCYLVKPADFAEFERALHKLVEFWAELAQLPRG